MVDRAVAELAPSSIVLYGSRARGTPRENSDWDLALFGVPDGPAWSRFRLDMAEDPPTVLPFDLVRYEEVGPALRAEIDREGVLLYSREADRDLRPDAELT